MAERFLLTSTCIAHRGRRQRHRHICAAALKLAVLMAPVALEAFGQPLPATVPVTVPGAVRDMHLMASGIGWVLTGQQILWTDTNGRNWTDVTPPLDHAQQIDNAYFLDPHHGWVLLHAETSTGTPSISMQLTTDGGQSWRTVELPASEAVKQGYSRRGEFSFPDDRHGWLILGAMTSSAMRRGYLFHTTDGGETWSMLPQPPVGGEIKFFADSTGWLVGGVYNDELYHTIDGARTWKPVTIALPAGIQPYSIPEGAGLVYHSHPYYEGPHFANEMQALLVVTLTLKELGDPVLLAYKTSDGGDTWVLQQVEKGPEVIGSPVLYNLDFVQMERSTTAALTLRQGQQTETHTLPSDFPNNSSIAEAQLVDARNGWLLGADGTLLTLIDGDLKAVLKPVPRVTKPQTPITAPQSGGSGQLLFPGQGLVPDIGGAAGASAIGIDSCQSIPAVYVNSLYGQ